MNKYIGISGVVLDAFVVGYISLNRFAGRYHGTIEEAVPLCLLFGSGAGLTLSAFLNYVWRDK